MSVCKDCGTTYSVKWYKDKTQCGRCYRRQRYETNPDHIKNTKLKSQFGLTLEQYKSLSELQQHLCAICRQPNQRGTNKPQLVIDHSHDTGRFRGLLCHHCNSGLGFFRDSIEFLASAITYLERFS